MSTAFLFCPAEVFYLFAFYLPVRPLRVHHYGYKDILVQVTGPNDIELSYLIRKIACYIRNEDQEHHSSLHHKTPYTSPKAPPYPQLRLVYPPYKTFPIVRPLM